MAHRASLSSAPLGTDVRHGIQSSTVLQRQSIGFTHGRLRSVDAKRCPGFGPHLSPWILPLLMAGFLVFGKIRKVRIYESFVEGAKDGFQVALRIIPYLVAILVAVGMLRASGALDVMVSVLGPVTGKVGMPAEALPMALMRPLSGSGAYGVLASIIQDPAVGPDSYTGVLVSTLQGSTETTFYVLAVYFGAVQVRRVRHALAAGLTADLAGVAFAVLACSFLLR